MSLHVIVSSLSLEEYARLLSLFVTGTLCKDVCFMLAGEFQLGSQTGASLLCDLIRIVAEVEALIETSYKVKQR